MGITVAITVVAVAALTGCGILANSLRHRNAELSEARDKNFELEGDLDGVRKSLSESRDKLRKSHQRNPKTKSLLPMGVNIDGSKV